MIIVTGATGTLGRLIVERLLDLVPADRIGASVRDVAKAGDLTARGIDVRHGDFANPETLPAAFAGATQLLLVSSNAQAYGGDAIAQHRAAIGAAKAAGVRRIVYTSHMGVGTSSAFPPMRDHAATEDMLRDSGLAWTSLRHGFYASTIFQVVGDAASTGSFMTPPDGKISWTAHADLAAADAQILVQEGRFEGPTPPLTGSEALDFGDIATILSEVHGKAIERRLIGDGDLRAGMAAHDVPPAIIDLLSGMYRAAAAGEFKATDPTLADLIGSAPTKVRDVIAAGKDTKASYA